MAIDELELWGGLECTVNRVGDRFNDQCLLSGHHDRPSDLDLFAELGIAALRYPVLWERISPDHPDEQDWSWTDVRLARLCELGIRPIVGLVHHGSGPRYTSLIDPGFAEGVARHARNVAERYDFVTDWTPINEPLTTARFSALYGHWYPHLRDERSFWTVLLNQIDAVRLSMREIRKINPAARLIQTDDLGRTYATAWLREQAAFDNTRRWMGWDLLCGKVTPKHPFWRRLRYFGLADRLKQIADDPCPPDVIGVNHYLTSDRFLDHRITRYPPAVRGGNKVQRYADVEAIRVISPPPSGVEGALREAWQRYKIPVAVTESHNGCTREEQMRWVREAWHTAERLRGDGVDVKAVTSWALLGSHGWNTLLVNEGSYECGVFDLRGGTPRPTAMGALLKSLTAGGAKRHPVLDGNGWWQRPIRLLHPTAPRAAPMRDHMTPPRWNGRDMPPPILITGATGTLGRAFARACALRDVEFVLTSRQQLDLDNPQSITAALERYRPWAVINAAGWVRVDDAEAESDGCFRANCHGALALARACHDRDIPTVSFSSDLVFDGLSERPYVESDETAPLSAYGRSKAECERALFDLGGPHLIVRTAAFFSPFDRYNFAAHLLDALAEGRPFRAAGDHVVSPTFVPDLVDATLDLLIDGAAGVWHLSNAAPVSWADFAVALAEQGGMNAALIEPVEGASLGWAAPRPRYSALGSERGAMLPTLDDAIERFLKRIEEQQSPSRQTVMQV